MLGMLAAGPVGVGGVSGAAVVACCELRKPTHPGSPSAYFGMFAVDTTMQGSGAGSLMLAEAERIAQFDWGAHAMTMTVLTAREELIAWYVRRGYRRTGELTLFPYGDPRFGTPRVPDLQFETLTKTLVR